jgi:hypothetical protein
MGAAGAIGGAQSGLQLFGAYEQAESLKAQGRYQRQQAYAQAAINEMIAKDVKAKGQTTALRVRQRASVFKGSQRATLAAQGIDIETGTPSEVLEETQTLSEMDALTAKNNAWREAFGYQAEASRLRTEGTYAYLASKNQARLTLLTGGLQAFTTGAHSYALSRGGR